MIVYDGIIDNWYYGNGISRYYRTIALGAANRGFDVKVFGFSDKFSFDEEDAGHKIDVDVVKSRFFERYRDFGVDLQAADVFHSSYYRLPSKNSLRTVKKIVTTVHDFVYERFAHGPKKYIHSWQKKKAILGSDIVICISESTRQDLYRFIPEFPKNKVRVVYNGVSSCFYPEIGNDVNISEPYVLFVGGRAGYKNFNLAVYAVSQLNNMLLVIVGGGAITVEEKKMLDNCIPGRYLVLGRVSDDVLRNYYSSAYALLYPSSFEGFGIPIIEAMRCGCPVMALRSPAIEEVSGGAAILADSADIDLFVNNLKKIEDNSVKSELIDLGLEWSKRFSWESCVSDTLSEYFS